MKTFIRKKVGHTTYKNILVNFASENETHNAIALHIIACIE